MQPPHAALNKHAKPFEELNGVFVQTCGAWFQSCWLTGEEKAGGRETSSGEVSWKVNRKRKQIIRHISRHTLVCELYSSPHGEERTTVTRAGFGNSALCSAGSSCLADDNNDVNALKLLHGSRRRWQLAEAGNAAEATGNAKVCRQIGTQPTAELLVPAHELPLAHSCGKRYEVRHEHGRAARQCSWDSMRRDSTWLWLATAGRATVLFGTSTQTVVMAQFAQLAQLPLSLSSSRVWISTWIFRSPRLPRWLWQSAVRDRVWVLVPVRVRVRVVFTFVLALIFFLLCSITATTTIETLT